MVAEVCLVPGPSMENTLQLGYELAQPEAANCAFSKLIVDVPPSFL